MSRSYRLAALAAVAASAALVIAAESKPKEFTAMQKRWWSLQPVAKAAVPAVQNKDWATNDIDRFVLARMEAKSVTPSKPADRITLLRRVTLDLTGLPPTPEEVQAFLADKSPDAYRKVVDRLLASPHYGERWARHWLDLARYSDSEGFKSDETRPNIWRYRDYVIRSFNSDKPYDRFVKEQIAGDELYPDNPDALVATGFNRHFPDESNARNLMQRRQELLFDITDVVGSTFMGLTMGCAKCHDHKFDPILQKDYYRLQASSPTRGLRTSWRWWIQAPPELRREVWRVGREDAHDPPRRWRRWWSRRRSRCSRRVSISSPKRFRTPSRRPPTSGLRSSGTCTTRPTAGGFSDEDAAKKLKGEAAKQYKELQKELAKFDDIKPAAMPVAQAMIDNDSDSPKTHVLSIGNYSSPMYEVEPGFLTILDPAPAKIVKPEGVKSSGRRSALAKWLTEPSNPLTARVMVNRVWHYHFGRGLSATPSDFGLMGERPTHPELLDYLTNTFVENGWSVKGLHRMILLSSTYQQSSEYREDAAKLDADNKLLWRFQRRRLEGETVRDAILSVSGSLNTKMFGPGVFPPLPPGVVSRGGWKSNEDPSEANRRSVYVFVRRNTRYPMFESFDMPDTHESCSRRNNTITAGQALELLNNELVYNWSKTLASRVANDAGMTPESQVERAYKLVYTRAPKTEETKAAVEFLQRHEQDHRGSKQELHRSLPHAAQFE